MNEARTVVTSVTDDETQRTIFLRIDSETGRILARLDPNGLLQGGTASHSNTFYAGLVSVTNGRVELIAVNSRTLAVQWRQVLAELRSGVFVPVLEAGLGIRAGLALAVSSDGSLLYAASALQDTVSGIGALDLATRKVVAFSGPFNTVSSMRYMQPIAPRLPHGALLCIASRRLTGATRRNAAVYFLDPRTLAPLDSITPEQLWGKPAQLLDVVMANGSQEILVGSDVGMVRYDLASGQVTARAARTNGLGLLIATTVSGPVFATSGGGQDLPGTGLVQMLNGTTFDVFGNIDISTPVGGIPRSSLATSAGYGESTADGKTVYLRTGTSPIGPLYLPQPARLFVLDVDARAVKRVVDLGGYNVGTIIVVPPR